jgi:FlaA1/EpsC-like NDP-sugar epimerase
VPVGFVDDDPKKAGKLIHGLRVYDAESLPLACEKLAVQEVIISTSNLSPLRLRRVVEQCDAIGLPLRQMQIQLARLNAWERDPLLEEPPLQVAAPLLHTRKHGSTHVVDASVIVRRERNSG